MTHLSKEQLAELTERVNSRFAEFGPDMFDMLTPGEVRVIYGVMDEWSFEGMYGKPAPDNGKYDWQLAPAKEHQAQSGADNHSENGNQAEMPLIGTILAEPDDDDDPPPATVATEAIEDAGKFAAEMTARGWNVENVAIADNGSDDDDDDLVDSIITPLEGLQITPPASMPLPRTLAEVDGLEDASANDDELDEERASLRMSKDEKAAHLRDVLTELTLMSNDGVTMPSMAEWDSKRPQGMSSAQAIIKRHELNWGDLAARARLKPKRGESNGKV